MSIEENNQKIGKIGGTQLIRNYSAVGNKQLNNKYEKIKFKQKKQLNVQGLIVA